MRKVQCVIIGGGSAGLAAAIELKKNGIDDLLILEKGPEPGGILNQCIHNGFGLHEFKEELSGPAYAERFAKQAEELGIPVECNTTVTAFYPDKTIEVSNSSGYEIIQAEAVVLAMGCQERTAGQIQIPGMRPQGVYTAGTAQRYVNIDGYQIGKRVFILGSGDIGLIMARRMTLEGAKVIGVAELQPYSNGLARNIKQCLEDFDIPLYLSHTVEAVHGESRLEYITLIEVDDKLQKIEGSEQKIECDCLLLSVGLIPENTLIEEIGVKLDPRTRGAIVDDNYMTSAEGIFACGNALHVHDLVDYVSQEGKKAGKAAADYVSGNVISSEKIANVVSNGVSYMVPQSFHKGKDLEFMFRVNRVFKDCAIHVYGEGLDKKLKKVGIVPSEMQKVLLKKEDLENLKGELHWEVLE